MRVLNVSACLVILLQALPVMAMDLVKQGQPVAQIIVGDSLPPPAVRGAPPWSDRYAAKVLADWIEKIADVRLVITNVPARGRPAIFVGQAAVAHGLKLDDIDSPSGEGLRVAVKGDTALIGGQNAESTVRAACRFLERLGCRYFMDSSTCKTNPALGEVFPRARDLSVEAFYGAQAGAPMKQYWMCIDQAFQNLPSEAGCFFAVHLVYTPERLALLQGLLDEAAKCAGGDASYAARVALANEGLKMSWDYMEFRDRLNRGDPAGAKETADRMLQRARDNPFAFHNKSVEYIRRFITRISDPAAATCAPPNRLLQVLPDAWLMRADPGEAGVGCGWQSRDLETWDWHPVRTYSASLSEQGFADRPAFQWYRTTFAAPAQFERLMLFFCDIDGAPETSRMFINGKEIKSDNHNCAFEPNRKDNGWRRREPVWSFIEGAVESGKTNTVALLLDHRNLSENALGGIVRPVYLVAVPADNGN